MKLIVVVPDGIINSKKTKPTISNTYKGALDLAIKEASKVSSKIVLLPANSFGTKKYEQDYAEQYLLHRKFDKNHILKGISNNDRYISTRKNFQLVMQYGLSNFGNKEIVRINHQLKEGLYTLVTSHLHIDRTLLILQYFNWKVPKKILVSYSKESHLITKRLFYYRFPILKMLYEIFTILAIKIEIKIKSIYKKNFFIKLKNMSSSK